MRLSIIIPVLNSHEIVRRQLLHFGKLDLSNDIEIFIMDDGSNPPLDFRHNIKNLTIYPTNDYRAWTQEIARNKGAELASGKNLIMVDADYILTREAIDCALEFDGDKMEFRRKFGILDEGGNIKTDKESLKRYGLIKKWIPRKGFEFVPGHRNNFCMKRELFIKMGGYKTSGAGKAYPYGGGPDSKFYTKWRVLARHGRVSLHDYKPIVYFIPNGKYCGHMDANPFNLFHNLSRKSGNFRSMLCEN